MKRFDYYNQLQQLHDSHINLDISFTLVNFGQKQVSLYHNINKRLAAETKSYLDKAWEEISQASKIEHEQRKDRELKRKLIKSAGMARAFSYFSKEGSIGGTLGSTNSSNNSGGAGGQWKSATIGGASEETSKTTDDILSVPFSLLSPTTATKKALSSNNIASYDVGAATTEKSVNGKQKIFKGNFINVYIIGILVWHFFLPVQCF